MSVGSSRRRFHVSMPESKIGPFDPSAAIYWNGRHHLFYIFTVPDSRFRKGFAAHWGHASSEDLIEWTFHAAVLEPDVGGADGLGTCWTGDIFELNGVPTIVYVGDHGQTCLAIPEDEDLLRWRKLAANPVIPAQPVDGARQEGDHAPFIWRETDVYYCIRGGHVTREGDTAFLFKSTEGVEWEYLHPLYRSERRWTETYEDLACPSFFELGGRHVLIGLSHLRGCHYYIGRWEDERFHPEQHGRLNWPGGHYGAPRTYLLPDGRRILWAWAGFAIDHVSYEAGYMAIPRVMTLSREGTLQLAPIAELRRIRGMERIRGASPLPVDEFVVLPNMTSSSYELEVTVSPQSASAIELHVLCSSDGGQFTAIRVDLADRTISIDVRQSSADVPDDPYRAVCTDRTAARFDVDYTITEDFESFDNSATLVQVAPFPTRPGEELSLRVFVDHDVLEVFANERQALCMQIYPDRADCERIRVRSRGADAQLTRSTGWSCESGRTAPR